MSITKDIQQAAKFLAQSESGRNALEALERLFSGRRLDWQDRLCLQLLIQHHYEEDPLVRTPNDASKNAVFRTLKAIRKERIKRWRAEEAKILKELRRSQV
ncbi:hypothetical protein H5P28_00220 [Ruficoccus amylovorans]|uniref:Uncharacterized protein n=1 Tax=Ruficoccus amylovorans TaxID=1804625 RepID=A0A842HAC4_9BACT|nr:hypothetical protein [Ruficoccus amylovorans]MBC2592676.1 hypothetical protein [Ruficoccus amylovorans]